MALQTKEAKRKKIATKFKLADAKRLKKLRGLDFIEPPKKRRNKMILTEEQRKEFEEVSKPLLEFINNNCHPHVCVNLTSTNAQLFEGICSFNTDEYLRD
jgi:hypothetical protein